MVTLWERSALDSSAGREANVELLCFVGPEGLRELPLVAPQLGIPSRKHLGLVEVLTVTREEDPQWFDGWRTESCRRIAERDLGNELAALDEATQCFVVRTQVTEPQDLGYLQSAWGIVRWLVARGGTCVMDVWAAKYSSAATLAERPADAAFDLAREVGWVLETGPDSAQGFHYFHSRGMRKFGRPDLITEIQMNQADRMWEAMRQICEALADGWMVRTMPQGVDLPDGRVLYLQPYEPEAA